jgi:hypothetical protein
VLTSPSTKGCAPEGILYRRHIHNQLGAPSMNFSVIQKDRPQPFVAYEITWVISLALGGLPVDPKTRPNSNKRKHRLGASPQNGDGSPQSPAWQSV